VFVCVADHFEPDLGGASPTLQRDRVARWVSEYGPSVEGFRDSRGRPPQHTFFYPVESYEAGLVEQLSALARRGYGDVEVHLHHDNDSAERLRTLLFAAVEQLHERHGLLSKDGAGRIKYGFIHGNWALDNSHPEGRWCGVDNELSILYETGCYADFTMPAAPSPEQTRIINSIYYARGRPGRSKSHDSGVIAEVGQRPGAGSLLMIQGPLLMTRRRLWSKPRLENGNLAGSQPPSAARLADWLRAGVRVRGHEQWLFVKLHTHGAKEANTAVLLGEPMRRFHSALRQYAHDNQFEYFYVTAREMAQLVVQAEQSMSKPDFHRLGWGAVRSERGWGTVTGQ
jgi:hypothetical protein